MEQFVFREFMTEKVIQKTIIFANAFHLRINQWRPANTKEHPYRINFYCDNLLVGYIDARVMRDQYIGIDMPFTLYTPFGRVIGHLQQSSGAFSYELFSRNNKAEMKGIFTAAYAQYDLLHQGLDKYKISSRMTIQDIDGVEIIVELSTNRINVRQCKKSEETLRTQYDGEILKIEHFEHSKINQIEIFANVEISLMERLREEGPTAKVLFHFLNQKHYDKDIMLSKEANNYRPYWLKMGFLPGEEIFHEMASHDDRIIDFLDEVHQAFTFLANGTTCISLLDTMASTCYHKPEQQFFHQFIKASDVEVILEDNPVLKKMNEPK